LIWGAYGIGEVLALTYLFGPIINNVPFVNNDKPIGGSVLPVLFFNVIALLLVVSLSLYSLGLWNIDLSSRRSRTEIVALAILLISGLGVWYFPVLLFGIVVSIIYLLAVHID
jgi:hypothetical protein